jgi:hypothetical protein
MGASLRKYGQFLSVVWLVMIASGCVQGLRTVHPELESRAKAIHAVGLASPDVRIYQLTAGGVTELMDDWCSQGETNLSDSVIRELKKKSVQAKALVLDKESQQELDEVMALYNAIATSISWHTYQNENAFPEKIKNFEYSVGPIDKILKKYKSDALLVVYGYDEISTGGRKALMAVGNVLGAVTGIQGPRKGVTVVSIGLLDRTGSLLWYNNWGNVGDYDLRDKGNAADISEALLDQFPRLGK